MKKDKRKIKPKKWYILDLLTKDKKGKHRIFRTEYDTKKAAIRELRRRSEENSYCYEVIQGETAIEFGFKFTRKMGPHYRQKFLKYVYPPSKELYQARKSFRTKYRRWKRNYNRELTSPWA